MCVPLALLSDAEIDLLPVESCRERGTRCAPNTLFAGARELLGSDASSARETSPDARLARCFAADTQAGESCASCARQLRAAPACE
jgi:hypothetical protein